ncbi:MAG: right-handed parallel beta-helix repeat-containing protein, partial [Anaerolineae bacterium]
NTAGGDYGGLFIEYVEDGSILRFQDNQIISNRAGITETMLVNNQVVQTNPRVLGGDGGGIWFDQISDGSKVHFNDNQILSNTAYLTGTTGGDYGGMYAYLYAAGLLVMEDNTIADNEAQKSFGGLYVNMRDGSRIVMEHNVIRANTAVTESGGVAISGEDNSQYFLRRNQIVSNSAGMAGGLWIKNVDTTPPIDPLWGISENNLVAGNLGSGVYLQDADFHSVNDTIADNATYGIMMTGTLTSTAYLSNTILWNHTWSFTRTQVVTYTDRFTMAADYSDVEGGWPGTGNINVNPSFVGSGDYHLQSGSLVIGVGNNAAAPAVDLDGVPRPVPAGGDADMGAYEWRLPGVELGPDLSATPDPGTQATFQHTITNTGNAQDTFGLSAVSAQGWTVQVSPSSATLPADGTAPVTVTVTVPAGLAAGTTDSINVTAASVPNPLVVDAAQDDITVALVPTMTLTPDRAAGALASSTVVYEHTLTNQGNGQDTFNLNATSSQGWSVTLTPYAATLPASGSTTVRAWLSVPSSVVSGTVDVMTVTATSAGDGSVSDSVIDTTTAYSTPPVPYAIYLPLVIRNY